MRSRFSLTIISFLVFISYSDQLFCQKTELQSGPMLGYSEMMEVMLWVQTKGPADVQFAYWDEQNPSDTLYTAYYLTKKEEFFTARLVADQVQPGKRYDYLLIINDEPVRLDYPTKFLSQVDWAYKTAPPEITLALGSCTYINEVPHDRPGSPYGNDYKIFESINAKNPDAMLWLGDNIYLRPADYYSWTGIGHRYTHTRSIAEMQPLLARAHNYAIWDDHDFGPNDSDRSFFLKDLTLEAFKLFWANPSYGVNGEKGITSQFTWGDIDFFLLDDRYFRSPNNRETGERTLLGKKQLEWLIDALTFSRAPFKMVVIGGQVVNNAPVYENYANHHHAEREYLLETINKEKIKGVIFLTGDRHHSELSKMKNSSGNWVLDLTVSPLTSGFHNASDEPNDFRDQGTHVAQRNFGIIKVTGPFRKRILTMSLYDVDGKELWTRAVRQSDWE